MSYPAGPNSITLKAYSQHVTEYIKNTPSNYQSYHIPLLRWINFSLKLIAPQSKVLEIGSATPREARYIRSKGFIVHASDAVPAFVDHLQDKGEDAFLLNLLTDEIEGDYAMIFANAVFSHFSRQEIIKALHKVYNALSPGSIFAFSVKQGNGEGWITEKFSAARYVKYWRPDEIYELAAAIGFIVVFKEQDINGDLPTHTWINIVARKP